MVCGEVEKILCYCLISCFSLFQCLFLIIVKFTLYSLSIYSLQRQFYHPHNMPPTSLCFVGCCMLATFSAFFYRHVASWNTQQSISDHLQQLKKTLHVLVVMLISCSEAQVKLSRKKNIAEMCMLNTHMHPSNTCCRAFFVPAARTLKCDGDVIAVSL